MNDNCCAEAQETIEKLRSELAHLKLQNSLMESRFCCANKAEGLNCWCDYDSFAGMCERCDG